MDLGKRTLKVLDQFGEAPLYRALPRDQDIIIAGHGMTWSGDPHRLFQPAARPVADHRAAQSLGRGEAEAGEVRVLRLTGRAWARLEQERGHGDASATPHMQELRACLETSDRRHRNVPPAYADRRLRPLARRRASTFRPPLVAMRARKPWRFLRTSREGWKVRFKGASPGSIAPTLNPRLQGGRIDDPGAYRGTRPRKSMRVAEAGKPEAGSNLIWLLAF